MSGNFLLLSKNRAFSNLNQIFDEIIHRNFNQIQWKIFKYILTKKNELNYPRVRSSMLSRVEIWLLFELIVNWLQLFNSSSFRRAGQYKIVIKS